MNRHWVDIMNDSRVGRYMDGVEKDLIRRHLPARPLSVLDVGGGTGRWSRWLKEAGHQQLLLDIDASALKTIQAHSPHLTIAQADAHCIPAPTGQFDVVIAVQLLGLLRDEAQFLREVRRVLKPDGLLFVSWSNRKSIKGLLYTLYSAAKGTPPAERHYFYRTSHAENMRLLEQAEFRVLEAVGYSWTLLPRSHNTPLVEAFVALERALRLNRWVAASPNIVAVAKKCES